MQHKHAIVIDNEGFMQTLVLVSIASEDEPLSEKPLYYEMKPGENLIYNGVPQALGMLKPQWTEKNGWQETATDDELAAIQPEQLPPPAPDPVELAVVELAELVLEEQQAVTMAIAEIFELVTGGQK